MIGTPPAGEILILVGTLAIGLVVFLLCGRLIGWALGISVISKNQVIIIEQNTDIHKQLEKLTDIQRAIAKKKGITATEMSGHRTEDYSTDPRFQNQA
jgi:hypothetical protein